jgi:hypothetical protein
MDNAQNSNTEVGLIINRIHHFDSLGYSTFEKFHILPDRLCVFPR